MAEILGCSVEEMSRSSFFDFVFDEDLHGAQRYFEEKKKGNKEPLDFRLRRKEGSEIWVHISSSQLLDANGSPMGILGMFTDILERKRTERALCESEERERARAEELKALMEAAPAIVWIAHDPECRIITGSRAAHELLQMPLGSNLSKTAPQNEQPTHFKVFKDGVELAPEELPIQMAARGIEVCDFEEEVVFDNGTELIRTQNINHPILKRMVEVIERQIQHMARLLDDLLDISRINSDKIQLRKDIVDLTTVMSHVLEVTLPLLKARQHRSSVSLPQGPIPLEVDPVRLEQILINLLNNAIKYTEPGGHIWFSGAQEGDEVVFRIRDTGVGIPPERLDRIFDLSGGSFSGSLTRLDS